MMLVELTGVPSEALPVAEFRDHLRLGSGFDDSTLQDGLLESCLRASLSAIEGRTSKALVARDFSWRLAAWRDLGAQALPVAPVSALLALVITDRLGAASTVDPEDYRLEPDATRPRLVANGLTLPVIPVGGSAEIRFTAGFGADWSDMPGDLAHAVMLLAAHFYERRDAAATGTLPPLVAALTERYRVIRLLGGGAA